MKLYILFFAILISCKPTLNIAELQNKEPLIILKKTSCKGKCPEYEVRIFQEGFATLNGIKNFELLGDYYKRIEKKRIESIISEFEKANFFSLNDKYISNKTDLPTTFLNFNYNGNKKKIMDYSDAPNVLNDLEKLIEDIAKEKDWLPIEKTKK